MSNTINIKCGLNGKIPLTPFTKRGMKPNKSLYKIKNRQPRGVVSLYFMVVTIIIFAFMAMTINFWIVNYSKISLQCAADLGAVAGAEVQANALNRIAEANGRTIELWNQFRQEYLLQKNCHVRTGAHNPCPSRNSGHITSNSCLLSDHKTKTTSSGNAKANVINIVNDYSRKFDDIEVDRNNFNSFDQLTTTSASETIRTNLVFFFNNKIANKCEINISPAGANFNRRRFRQSIDCFYEWFTCSLSTHTHPENHTHTHCRHSNFSGTAFATTANFPLWWEKRTDLITYTRVTATLPAGTIKFIGSGMFGSSPQISAVSQARPFGGYCYLTNSLIGKSEDQRRSYPYYRSKLFSLRRNVNPDVGYPAGSSRRDYYH